MIVTTTTTTTIIVIVVVVNIMLSNILGDPYSMIFVIHQIEDVHCFTSPFGMLIYPTRLTFL
jgi:hypothetical protein